MIRRGLLPPMRKPLPQPQRRSPLAAFVQAGLARGRVGRPVVVKPRVVALGRPRPSPLGKPISRPPVVKVQPASLPDVMPSPVPPSPAIPPPVVIVQVQPPLPAIVPTKGPVDPLIQGANMVGAELGIPGAAGFVAAAEQQPVLAVLTGGLSAGMGEVINLLPKPVQQAIGAVTGALGNAGAAVVKELGDILSTGATTAAQAAVNQANAVAVETAIAQQIAVQAVDTSDKQAVQQVQQQVLATLGATNPVADLAIDKKTRQER